LVRFITNHQGNQTIFQDYLAKESSLKLLKPSGNTIWHQLHHAKNFEGENTFVAIGGQQGWEKVVYKQEIK